MRVGDRFVVAVPHFLLPALVHALLELALEHELVDVAADRFHDAVYGSVLLSARYFAWDEIDAGLPALGDLRVHESVFLFDRDKLAHIVVLTDDLTTFDGDPFTGWNAQALAPAVEARLDEVHDHLLALPQQPDQVLQLVVVQGLDRPQVFALEDGSERAPRLVLTAADLETLALLEGGRRLLLWKYARARKRFLERTQAVGGGELDLFHLYRANDDSFYLSDDALPDVCFVLPEGVGELRRESPADARPARHAVHQRRARRGHADPTAARDPDLHADATAAGRAACAPGRGLRPSGLDLWADRDT